jgi:RHS repeat-associated protein
MNRLRSILRPRLLAVLLSQGLLLCFCVPLHAQQMGAVYSDCGNRLSGSDGSLAVGASVDLTYTSAGEKSHFIRNIVSLNLNEESSAFLSDNFTAYVVVTIAYGSSSSSTSSINQTLTVTYSKQGGVTYNPHNYLTFQNAQYVKVTVDSIVAPILSNNYNTDSLLVLKDEMQVWRTMALSDSLNITPTLAHTAPPSTPIPDELPVTWTPQSNTGNTGYQLEWAWVENELRSYYSSYELLFRNNSTRVDLPLGTTGYNIPLYYDGVGQLFSRVRAVNILSNGTLTYSPWSAIDSFPFGGHNNNLNWQVSTAYAEEGKRKAVMQYYDGSLRQRQTVTKDNTTNTTLTAETFYDGQGRPAIQVLPAPGIDSIVAYTQNLNLFNGQAYDSTPGEFFDLRPLNSLSNAVPAMANSSGAALYYSPNNPEISQNANQNIPDAAGYPYTATQYTPDATGRVMIQSGVGPVLSMGGGHETKYYYGSAAQEELDGLFGTEAGDFTHYFKNMVQDANGQMSVSYVDMHGRTIATALAGDAPPGIAALNLTDGQYPGQAGTPITRNLLNGNANAVRGNSIEAFTTLLVPVTTAYTFNYALTPPIDSTASCKNTTICYDCLYNLQIAITDESGTYPPVIRTFDNVSLGSANSCSVAPGYRNDYGTDSASTVAGSSISFSTTLLPGSYAVWKTLTVSRASEQHFDSLFLVGDTCTSEQQLIDSVYQVLKASSGCAVPVTAAPCVSCLNALGSFAAFRANYLSNAANCDYPSDSAIHALYTADSLSCSNMCSGGPHLLDAIQAQMLGDMMPWTGQYAQNPDTVSTPGTMFFKYNIFSTYGYAGQPYFLHPENNSGQAGFYLDAMGNRDQSVQPGGVLLSPLSDSTFTNMFSPSWASALLPRHPEYPQLVWAQQHLGNSYGWIENFGAVSSFSLAIAQGYTTSAGLTENVDTFFTLPGTPKSLMNTYETTGSYYNGLSLWQMAYSSVMYRTVTNQQTLIADAQSAPLHPPFTGLTTGAQDSIWQIYQGLYLNVRDSMLTAYLLANVPHGDDSALVAQGFILRFPATVAQEAQQYGWTGFPTTPGAAPNVNFADSVTEMDTLRCASYISTWVNELSQCPTLTGRSDSAAILAQITAGMETVCRNGQDEANPYGSSSDAPGYPNDGSPRTFQAVINSVFQAHGIDTTQQYCNPFVIDFPKPYGENPVIAPAPLAVGVDTCACKQFAAIRTAATTAGYDPTNLTSLNTYLNLTYHDTLTQAFFNGLQQCSSLPLVYCNYDTVVIRVAYGANPCPGDSVWTRYGAGEENGIPADSADVGCRYGSCDTSYLIPLATPQRKPAFLECGYNNTPGCLTCARLSALVASYKAYFHNQACDSAPVLSTNLTPAQISYNVTFATYVNYQTGLQLNWTDYAAAANATGCNLGNYGSNGSDTVTVVCGSSLPLTDTTGILEIDSPCAKAYLQATAIGQSLYQERQAAALASFDSAYSAKCLSASSLEKFSVGYTTSEYHYTLYYYDMAGNLVKTVPPKGARPNFSAAFIKSVDSSRAIGAVDTPQHLFSTRYCYNSLNSVIAQRTPDAAVSHFWYDRLGRLVVSQNAQQAHDGNYSYTVYDPLSRIIEVGQTPQGTAMTQATSQDSTGLANWMNATTSSRNQVTYTGYDLATFNMGSLMTQNNLRNRVSYTYTKNHATDGSLYTATYYTYDVHGNVDTMIQSYTGLSAMSATPFKRICYDYDLVSGKVNGVDYQPGNSDAFYYRYLYDAENRLTNVLTSRDSITWEQDASYVYYKHGPLSRTVLGQLQAQGIDYTYTLQGWLKGANIGNGFGAAVVDSSGSFCAPGSALSDVVVTSRSVTDTPYTYTARSSITFESGFETYDGDSLQTNVNDSLTACNLPASGGDTASASGLSEAYPVAQDAYSYSLHYYPGDYNAIGATTPVTDVLTTLGSQANPMYNGNIAASAVVLPGGLRPQVYSYQYDQLNRLVQMKVDTGLNAATHTFTPVSLPDYGERVAYDPNGNINGYVRHGYGANIPMDSLTYHYYANTNQLQRINDSAGGSYTTDLKDQGTGNNYTYDLNGQLKQDLADTVTAIDWTVYGKIDTIVNGHGTITYTYDAAGNRITKSFGGTNSIYVRDAQGNILAVYTQSGSGAPLQTEVDLYGSSRLGTVGPLTVSPTSVALSGSYGTAWLNTFSRGEKSYELTNHLGNVLSTITDKKIAVSSGGSSLIDHFLPDVATAQDYYPFGMVMPGRTYPGSTASSYRYGFNGKENDNEVEGTGNSIDYGMRVYDPRVGRFLSVDPLEGKYPWYTPYQYAGNKPIFAVDLDGLEDVSANKATWKQKVGFAFFAGSQMIMATGNYLSKKLNVSTTGGYRGPLADAGQKVITSVGSTLNGGLHAVTAGAWPLDPSATLGFDPSLNPGASNVGQAGGTVTSIGFGGTPGASLELAPAADGSSALQSLNQALHIPLTVYSNASSTDDNSSSDNTPTQSSSSNFKPSPIFRNPRGQLTNGKYILDETGMQPHLSGDLSSGKSQFLFNVDANTATLDAAAYADQFNLWNAKTNSAKVPVTNGNIGVLGKTGELTNYINVYRTNTGFVHSSPGTPPPRTQP